MACDGQGAATDSVILDHGRALMMCFSSVGLELRGVFVFLLVVRVWMRRSDVYYLLLIQPKFFDETANPGGLCQDLCTSRAPQL